ncbi:ammonium transporter [Heliomicrobium modesticaldum Ice1]|uniref:Ammonium transporter n=1 Tax=Heliobacterium modesticaldum (strain ATCC 51547 / Ice1) TaxID=498761 RepID=B0TB87_HELMI|nr:ammonium transporter [Heliomicrobium modesticaldum]ABZ83814.1 ammonium transporter [Heliomicrobium modesticaldum Ice1]
MKRIALFAILMLLAVTCLGLAPAFADEVAPAAAAATDVAATTEAPAAAAAEAPKADTGDTAFIIISAALVMLMTPGLALFYGGMVRKKNVLSTMMHSFIIICLVSVIWVLYGYSLAFGTDINGMIGSLDFALFNNVGPDPNPDYSATIPHSIFSMFQLMFAIITAALISGAFAERMRFSAFLLFTVIWISVIYFPLAHWVWGVGGWLRDLGALDFAGGTVVHISSGVSGLVLAILLGKRRGLGTTPMPPHQLPMTVLGAGLLWFGWFGFNAGSALGANGLAGSAFVTTNTAAAAAALSWIFAEWIRQGKPTVLGAASGAVAGLVAITPAAGFVTAGSALVIGLLSGVICYFAVVLKPRLGYDDALDAFGIHGVGGTFGAIATGIFATTTVNSAGADGLLYGSSELLVKQLIAVGASYAFAAIGTFIIYMIVNAVFKARVTVEDEETGLDITQHGEEGYPDFAVQAGGLSGISYASSSASSTVVHSH